MCRSSHPGKTLLLADGLSRLPKQGTDPAIQLDVRVNLVHFSAHRTEQLRQETARDLELGPLHDVIIGGWPMEQRNMPTVLKPYWAYCDELSLEDGIILKGSEQVQVPKSMQQYVLQAIHEGHQGRDKCRLWAKASVYWNRINKQIEEMVADCPACQEHARSQRKEPHIPKEVPPCPWHTLAADFFQLDGSE